MLKINEKQKVQISGEKLKQYQNECIVYIESFHDITTEILPIQKDIYRTIELLIAEYRLPINQAPFTSEHFDAGLPDLVAHHCEYASIL